MNQPSKKLKIAVIGAGFSGLSGASYAGMAGHQVHVFEKHAIPGGRARQFTTPEGYVFDMGPSWYWMPDIIEDFFKDFGRSANEFYDLVSLDPQFEILFKEDKVNLPKDYSEQKALFESIEKGAGEQLDAFMEDAKYKYEVGMRQFVSKPSHSWLEFFSPTIAKSALRLDLLSDYRSFVAKYFKDSRLRTIMEFPVIFLGASPKDIPALYSLMNYGGYQMGTFYPMGGFFELVKAMEQIALSQGVTFHYSSNVEKIITEGGKATALQIDGQYHFFDQIIASSDYHHTETKLPAEKRNYTEAYWEKRTFAPSCLIYYLGVREKIEGLKHHTLFFEHDLDPHIETIYGNKRWPENPLFYVCCPSKTDPEVAPEGKENIFLLMPLAIGIEDEESVREKYLQEMLQRIEKHTGAKDLHSKLEYKRSYCVSDFKKDYNAYGGNAYGLANILSQTAVLKPKLKNKKLKNLFYTGQLTVPGPGVPPSIISGKIAAREATKNT